MFLQQKTIHKRASFLLSTSIKSNVSVCNWCTLCRLIPASVQRGYSFPDGYWQKLRTSWFRVRSKVQTKALVVGYQVLILYSNSQWIERYINLLYLALARRNSIYNADVINDGCTSVTNSALLNIFTRRCSGFSASKILLSDIG